MSLDGEADVARDLVERELETRVREGLHAAAVVADRMMVVLTVRLHRLEVGDASAELDALHESHCGKLVEHAVDARDPHGPARDPRAVEDLLRRQAARLAAEQLDDCGPGPAAAKPRLPESLVCVADPAWARIHLLMIAILIPGRLGFGVTRTVLTLVVVVGLSGCGGESAVSGETVVAGFYPLAYAAERVGEAGLDVRNLTPPGVEPHDLELSGSDVRAVADAKLVLYLGSDFQPALERAVASTDAAALDLLEDAELLDAGEHGHDEEDGAESRDPHVWLDPLRYAALAQAVATALDRPGAAQPLVAELRGLDEELALGLRDCERRELVTSHAAFGYLTDRYGLEQVPITGLSPEAEPTPGELRDVVQQVRARGATTIFFETLVSPRLAETVAREVGAMTAVLNPLEGLTEQQIADGENYFSVMRENLAALRKALQCR